MKNDELMSEINEVLRAYNYLDEQDEDIDAEDLPSLVSHLLLLRIFTHESMRFGVKYEEVDDFCDFAVEHIYQMDNKGQDISEIDVEDIVDAYRAKQQGSKH